MKFIKNLVQHFVRGYQFGTEGIILCLCCETAGVEGKFLHVGYRIGQWHRNRTQFEPAWED